MKKSERESYKAQLREVLPAGSTVYMTLSRVSRSGMSRVIKCIAKDGDAVRDISWLVANATEHGYVDGYNGGVRIGGCGMDMGLALADCISYALYGKPVDQRNDYAIKKGEEGTGGVRYRWL